MSFNVVTNFSLVNCKPVSFDFLGGQFSTYETPIIFNNGLKLNTHDCLKNCLSYKSNNKTTLFLTDLTTSKEVLIDKIPPADVGIFTEINSPITDKTVFYSPIGNSNYKVLVLSPSSTRTYYSQLSSSVLTTINEDNVFKFIFQSDNTVVVESSKNSYYLTSYYETNKFANLYFQPKIIPILSAANDFVDQQRFDYSLGPRNITLYQISDEFLLPRFTNVVMQLRSGVYACSSISYLTSASKFPKESAINFISYKELPQLNSDIKNSFLAKYKINPLIKQSELIIDTNYRNKKYTQNYLGIFPTEYYVDNLSSANFPLAFHSLKNYQTPEYKYSFGYDYDSTQDGLKRVYENIYTGTNQDKGLDNVYLGYKAKTLEISFPPDKETGFNFGPTSNSVSLASCGLIEDGAIAGEVPFTSDRIYIKQKDYTEEIPDSPQPSNIPIKDNTWLCSWLYGTMSGQKQWMDRYYNPAYYDSTQALSAKLMLYNEKLYPTKDYIYDVPSTMVLAPDVLYKYFHTGRKNRLTFINHLSSNSILQVTKWNSSPLKDESPENGEGIIYFRNSNTLKGDYINLDGTNHVLFPATTELLSQSKLTISMFLNVDDWSRVDGNQIFGNYYGSGFGLINESSLTTPIITLIDNNTTTLYNLNYRFSKLNTFKINDGSNLSLNGNKIIQRLPDYSYWVFDSSYRNNRWETIGIKYDVNNEVIKQAKINSQSNLEAYNAFRNNLKFVDQIEVDKNENLYLFSKDTKKYVIIGTMGNLLASGSLSENTNTIQLRINFSENLVNNIIPCFGSQSAIDINDNIWEIVGGNLYVNKNIFGNIGNVQQMKFDADNYLWILCGQDTISKIDTVNKKVLFSKRLGKNSTLPEDPCFDYSKQSRYMSFIRVPKDNTSDPCNSSLSKTEDRLIIVDLNDEQLYMLNSSGFVLTKLNLYNLTGGNLNLNMLISGDFTGYEFLRKYTASVKKLSWKMLISKPNGKTPMLLSLPYDISNISEGWHNFTLVFDAQVGFVKTYLDSILINNKTFTPDIYQLYYTYRTSLLLGCETIANTTLNDIIQIDNGYKFIGKVAELRLYNKSLTQGEIEQLFLSSKYAADDRNLIWNMSVGERNYIEQIKYWYKMQLPGSKSKYFNVNIHNLNVPSNIKNVIENGIKKNISKISPAHSSLYKINWK
jgi:hypothetical protein